MDYSDIFYTAISIIAVAVVTFILLKFKKNEPLTYAEFFLKDQNPRFLHILGARRIMPENGDSFDIFETYVLDLAGLTFTKGGSQKGKNLELKSEFVKRSMAMLSSKLNTPLQPTPASDDMDDEENGLLKVYRFEEIQSDTETFDTMSADCLVFIDKGDDAGNFKMNLYRNGQLLKEHYMKGMSDYFFKTIYVEEKTWLCFTYRKQKSLLISGMAVCILNYETGELIFDEFIRPGKGG